MCFLIIGIVTFIGAFWNYIKFNETGRPIIGIQSGLAIICFALAIATIISPLLLEVKRERVIANPNYAQIQAFNLELGKEQSSFIARPAWYINYNKLMSLEPIEEKDYDI